jgi:hypothetical protein
VPFPVNAKLTQARRTYRAELERVERLAYEGKRPRFNARIKADYYAALREAEGWALGEENAK